MMIALHKNACTSTNDFPHTAHRLQTTLTPAQETIVVHLRTTLLLPLDDLLAVTREFLSPKASRSGIVRCQFPPPARRACRHRGRQCAGKSTFVRLITGAEQPNSGDLLLDGKKVIFKSPLDARDQGMETVYQTLALAEDLDVPANIFLGREITRINLGPLSILNHKAMREQSTSMLSTTGVKIQDMSESLRGMSGGQRQCVAIARAAGFAKKLIILDEPTAARG